MSYQIYPGDRVNPKRICTLHDIEQNLIFWLPDEQKPFLDTKPYLELCDAVFAVLKANVDDRPEKQQELKHARSVFEDFCNFEIENFKQLQEIQRQEHEALQSRIDSMRKKEPTMKDLGWGSL